MPPCDIVIDTKNNRRIYINGHEVTNVVEVSVSASAGTMTELELRIIPTSIVYGDPPAPDVTDHYTDGDGQTRSVPVPVAKARRKSDAARAIT
jgi:hypothetical protein